MAVYRFFVREQNIFGTPEECRTHELTVTYLVQQYNYFCQSALYLNRNIFSLAVIENEFNELVSSTSVSLAKVLRNRKYFDQIRLSRRRLPTLPKTWRSSKQGCYTCRFSQVSLSAFLPPQVAQISYTARYPLYQQNLFRTPCRHFSQKKSYEVSNLAFVGCGAGFPPQSVIPSISNYPPNFEHSHCPTWMKLPVQIHFGLVLYVAHKGGMLIHKKLYRYKSKSVTGARAYLQGVKFQIKKCKRNKSHPKKIYRTNFIRIVQWKRFEIRGEGRRRGGVQGEGIQMRQ